MNKLIQNTQAIKGIIWFIVSLVVGSLCDALMKHLATSITAYQITCLRYVFAAITLLPWLVTDPKSFSTSRLHVHAIRGALLFASISLWVMGLNITKLAVATTINFTIPIFVMLLAIEFLKERCSTTQVIATILGFVGIFVALDPVSDGFSSSSLVLIGSALMFASLDVINKKFVSSESMMCMLFYSNVFTAVFAFIPAAYSWTPIGDDIRAWALFAALGIGGNAVLYCLLKSFSYIAVSAVAPYRYLELVFATALGIVSFSEQLTIVNYVGAGLVIGSTVLLLYKVAFKEKHG